MKELTRWSEDAPDDYLAAKAAHAELGPNADQLARLLARLPAAAESQTPAATTTTVTRVLNGKAWLWLVPALALLSLTAWLLRPSAPELTQAPEPPAPSPAPKTPHVTPPGVPVAPAEAPPQVQLPPRKETAPEKRTRDAVSATDPAAELLLLERARRILAANPTRTLALTDEHRHTFRPGLFAEERELLAIEALVRLKQTQAATHRARAFSRAHPNSVHARRLETILQGDASP